MRELLEWAQLVNLLLLPLAVYLVRLERVLSRIVTQLKAHEESDAQKFAHLYAFKDDIDRRGRDRIMG